MKTILLMEDNTAQALFFIREFRREGYHVLLARNGTEALAQVREQIPDIIIMELTSSFIDWDGDMRALLGTFRGIPLIINTAYDCQREKFRNWLPDACVVKSADLSELKSKVQEQLYENDLCLRQVS
ncbi:MAG: response regulator [Candidatus Scalindua sp. AMX11]|nr:MAG: response regulator [Candidatus Scalindua sp.]NOG84866.1 response regulator [Planctomycetota bacterium]RZV84935.1 MAG: response regulator [Candidatus Scalindua sp. SCAELEC01]TDE65073.1 MAG: response regulator [Candidatus Scalindua sp. AMX11]GJQ59465.1 MAG: two-component system response regulator [Candidatus Scalindua sp.]